jgi:hypothetical protein
MVKGGNRKLARKIIQFYEEGTKGRVMALKEYYSEEANWGKGMIYHFEKGHPFLLSVMRDWYLSNPEGLIGDIDGFLKAQGEEDEHEIQSTYRKIKMEFNMKRCQRELSNILKRKRSE